MERLRHIGAYRPALPVPCWAVISMRFTSHSWPLIPGSSPRLMSRLRTGAPLMISVGNRRIGRLSVTSGSNPVGRNVSTGSKPEYWKAQRNRESDRLCWPLPAGDRDFVAVGHINQISRRSPGASDNCLTETGAGKSPDRLKSHAAPGHRSSEADSAASSRRSTTVTAPSRGTLRHRGFARRSPAAYRRQNHRFPVRCTPASQSYPAVYPDNDGKIIHAVMVRNGQRFTDVVFDQPHSCQPLYTCCAVRLGVLA